MTSINKIVIMTLSIVCAPWFLYDVASSYIIYIINIGTS